MTAPEIPTSDRPSSADDSNRWKLLRRRALFSLFVGGVFFVLLIGADRLVGFFMSDGLPRSLLLPSNSTVRHESCEFDVQVHISSAGIRDREFTPGPPPADTLRIVAVGDSFTFGWGVEGEQSWPKVLEQNWNEQLTGNAENVAGILRGKRKVEVLNFGMPGTSPATHGETAQKAIRYFQPDVLIVAALQGDDLIQLHDHSPTSPSFPQRLTEGCFPHFRRMLSPVTAAPMESYREVFLKSQAYVRSTLTQREQRRYLEIREPIRSAFDKGLLNPAHVQLALTKPNYFNEPVEANRGWRQSVGEKLDEAFKKLKAHCEASDCRLIVAVVPYGPYVSQPAWDGAAAVGFELSEELLITEMPDRLVIDACGRADLPCIVLTSHFRGLTDELYFPWDGHLNERGHAEFATGLLRELEELK